MSIYAYPFSLVGHQLRLKDFYSSAPWLACAGHVQTISNKSLLIYHKQNIKSKFQSYLHLHIVRNFKTNHHHHHQQSLVPCQGWLHEFCVSIPNQYIYIYRMSYISKCSIQMMEVHVSNFSLDIATLSVSNMIQAPLIYFFKNKLLRFDLLRQLPVKKYPFFLTFVKCKKLPNKKRRKKKRNRYIYIYIYMVLLSKLLINGCTSLHDGGARFPFIVRDLVKYPTYFAHGVSDQT